MSKFVVPSMSSNLLVDVKEYKYAFQLPKGASAGISYLISNIPSAVSEKAFSNTIRPRESRICIFTGIPAND